MASEVEKPLQGADSTFISNATEGNHIVDSPEVYSVYGNITRRLIVLTVALAGCFSPLATNMYLPAFDALAHDLHQSIVKINLSMTTYLIFQGLTPTLFGPLADQSGRRLLYMACFIIFIPANIGLALQSHYAAFLALRAMQSAGSSTTIALATAVVTDISPTSERGVAMGYVFAGFLTGQSLSPVLGGILSHSLGWRWIFWFLAITSAAFFLVLLLLLPETSRLLVGNGSRRPPRVSMCLADVFLTCRRQDEGRRASRRSKDGTLWHPLLAMQILRDPLICLVVLANGINFCGATATSTSQPSIFKGVYHLNDLQVGLCFLPFGIGGIVASYAQGKLTDYNYRRHARRTATRHSLPTEESQGRRNFSLIIPRVEMLPPLAIAQCAAALGYGWMLHGSVPLAGPLVCLFLLGYTGGAMMNVLNVLTADLCVGRPATSTAVTNLVRCLMGAGVSAAIGPLIEATGRGWAFTIIPGFSSILFIPLVVALMWRGRDAS